jgi:hypothetical protein
MCCKQRPLSNLDILTELCARRDLSYLQDWRRLHQDGIGHSVETVAIAQQHTCSILFMVRQITFEHGCYGFRRNVGFIHYRGD